MMAEFDPEKLSKGLANLERHFSDMPLDYPEAHMGLIDALRNYIRTDEALARDLLNEGSITLKQYDAGNFAIQPMRLMLADLEKHEINPTLGLKERR
jgi:hypothetical protein